MFSKKEWIEPLLASVCVCRNPCRRVDRHPGPIHPEKHDAHNRLDLVRRRDRDVDHNMVCGSLWQDNVDSRR